MTLEQFESYGWKGLSHLPLEIEDLQHICGLYRNYWSCDPLNPGKYHAEWSSGLHSADFFNLADTLRASFVLRNLLAYQMVHALYRHLTVRERFTAVVGSATGSTILAEAIATQTGVRFIEMVKGQDKAQTWKEGQPPLREDDVLFHVEELTSTLTTPGRVREGVEAFHAGLPYKVNWLHRFVVGVDRRPLESPSTLPMVGSSTAIMLTQFLSRLYEPDKCPMCQAGSTPIRPRGNDGANWKLLTGT